jgi:CDGSH-type Zn-finger protein
MVDRDVVIVPYKDGPYLVRGPVLLLDQDGQGIEINRRTIALCRCGKSRMRPFCDGTHRLIGFRVPSEPERPRERKPGSVEPVSDAGTLQKNRPQLGSTTRSQSRSTLPSNGSSPDRFTPQHAGGCSRTEALRTAESLLTTAHLLAERELHDAADEQAALEPNWTAPTRCLVKGAIDALSPFAGDGEPHIARAVKDLTGLVVRLTTTSERA